MGDNDTRQEMRSLGRALVRELGVLEAAASPGDLALSHCHILVELDRYGTLTAKELSEILLVDKAAISRAVTQLTEAGLLSFGEDATDKRRHPLALTPAGRRKAAQIHDSANRRVEEALSLCSPAERRQILSGLSLYVSALSKARLAKKAAAPKSGGQGR